MLISKAREIPRGLGTFPGTKYKGHNGKPPRKKKGWLSFDLEFAARSRRFGKVFGASCGCGGNIARKRWQQSQLEINWDEAGIRWNPLQLELGLLSHRALSALVCMT
jgi:hypothetical protein